MVSLEGFLGAWSGKLKEEVKRTTYLHSRLNQKNWQILWAGLSPQTLRLVSLITWFAFFCGFDVKTWAFLEAHLPMAAALEGSLPGPILAKCPSLGTPFSFFWTPSFHTSGDEVFPKTHGEKHNSLPQWSRPKTFRRVQRWGSFFERWNPSSGVLFFF